jgi:hypothetical protein
VIFPLVLLSASVAILFLQLSFFTTLAELVIGTAVGIAIYAVTVFYVARGRYSIPGRVGWSIVAGIILGVLPPRLRVSGATDAFVLVYPLVHIALLTGFVSLYRGARGKHGRS